MSPARWALSPLDCQAHLLVCVGEHPQGALKAQCGHLMSSVVPHQPEQPPGRRSRCVTCAAISRVPPPRFPHKFPADRRSSSCPEPLPPGGQSDPLSAALERVVAVLRLVHPGIQARWALCPLDGHLHLLAPAGAAAQGFGYALCGRAVAADGLADSEWSSGMHWVSCLAAGIAS